MTEGNGHSALYLLHRAGQCADELFAVTIGDSATTPRQYAVLKAVAGSEGTSQTQLVEKTGIDRSTLSDIVRRLAQRGLLARHRTKRDARMYSVRLTEKGNEVLRRAEPAARSTNERLLATIPVAQRDVLLRGLAAIVELQSSQTGK